ncbi:TetR family transcriptional regulator [Anaeromyxobacter sp. Red801]
MARRPAPGAHEALLEAAREEICRHGLAHARVEDIARRAGISKGAFYLHFPTKDAAFAEIVQRLYGALEEQTRRREEAERRFDRDHRDEDGPALLRAQLEFEVAVDLESLELLWRNRHVIRALEAAGPAWTRGLAGFRRRLQRALRDRIAAKQAAGRLRRDIDPSAVADLLVGTYEGFVRRTAELRQKPDLAGWARSFLTIFYEGMAGPAARAAPPARARRTAS